MQDAGCRMQDVQCTMYDVRITNNQQPITNSQQPITNSQQPITSHGFRFSMYLCYMCMESIKTSIARVISLNESDWKIFSSHLKTRILAKHGHFLSEGQVCSSVAFVCSGTLVYYKLLKSGEEATTDFAFPGDWVTNNSSRLSQTPSRLNIKAIEDCELITISQADLEKCYLKIPSLERLGRILIEQAYVRIALQSIDLQTLSASQRYQKLLKEHPDIIQSIPLYHIASYLGIAPKSLSRIRREKIPVE